MVIIDIDYLLVWLIDLTLFNFKFLQIRVDRILIYVTDINTNLGNF